LFVFAELEVQHSAKDEQNAYDWRSCYTATSNIVSSKSLCLYFQAYKMFK